MCFLPFGCPSFRYAPGSAVQNKHLRRIPTLPTPNGNWRLGDLPKFRKIKGKTSMWVSATIFEHEEPSRDTISMMSMMYLYIGMLKFPRRIHSMHACFDIIFHLVHDLKSNLETCAFSDTSIGTDNYFLPRSICLA